MSSSKLASIQSKLPLLFPHEQLGKNTKEDINSDAAWHFYSHAIQRNTHDLLSHTRRIFLAIQHENSSFLSGALQDLFIILKDAGRPLRIRLLKASVPYLTEKDVIYFADWIKSEANTKTGNNYGSNWVSGSMLSKGLFAADNELITKEKELTKNIELSAIDEARSFIEYGQLDLAKKTLEEAITQDESNLELKKELDNLLQYTNNDNEEQDNHAMGE